MTSKTHPEIVIQGAKTNNLKNISLRIPHNKFIVVTGVSGSGKSSLVFDIIAKEGQRRYFETLPSFARQFMGKLSRPNVDTIEGLSPVIAIGQHTTGMHARSTVGTLSDIYDLLRLLFARIGTTDKPIALSRALFSFNSTVGKCPQCNGIGAVEKIALDRLIRNPEKTLREGALAPTLPNGYIMYSQVTIDVLNQVCEAEGFNVDIPWDKLSDSQREVILYGSDKIKVPFGKHSLESRLKWTGIKAKPRENGHYKGMIPIMSDILKRDRNANILKYVHAITCSSCHGSRLNRDALAVTIHGKSIADVVKFELNELKTWIHENKWDNVGAKITDSIEAQVNLLYDLGLGHLTLDRPSKSLRGSEIQRIRLANQMLVPLSDVLYVFDEPSIGLHREENERLLYHFKQLVKRGNTVIVVEHDLETISSADHIIELGPGAGINGGSLIFNGSYKSFIGSNELNKISPTFQAIHSSVQGVNTIKKTKAGFKKDDQSIQLFGCHARNLQTIDIEFKVGKLNVVSGRSGVGKSSLVKDTLLPIVRQHLGQEIDKNIHVSRHEKIDAINKLIFIDHSPIGKTPRSNPATYLGISDHIRDVYAALASSKKRGFTRSRFSFNNKGGRCETCQGAGKTQIGMHFLGNVDLICGACNGKRFNEETLGVKYKGKSIADVYSLSVKEAIVFFDDEKKVLKGLRLLKEIGLGYLCLGQSSTTLSGGEAQRIKIANQLQKKDTGDTLYIIIEPSIGLHDNDIRSLLPLFDAIKEKGNTIVCIEQNDTIIQRSDWHIELGPQSGQAGGRIVHQGKPVVLQRNLIKESINKGNLKSVKVAKDPMLSNSILLKGVTTHGLKNVDVCIPKNQLTVVTGRSGSGKSSLVYDTLFAESNARFTESLSTYNRSFLKQNNQAKIERFSGLGPAIGISRKGGSPSKRSTVGTLSGIYDAFRLLYSRIAQHHGQTYTAQHYSFNHHLGACNECKGLGVNLMCDPEAIIVEPEKSIFDGAISTNKIIAYYADVNGQFIATLMELAKQKEWDIDRPWYSLENEIKEAILYGTGDKEYTVVWKFKTKSRSGTQSLKAKWIGLCAYVDDEYQRKRHNKNIQGIEALLHRVLCTSCQGSRLKPDMLTTTFLGLNIYELCQLNITSCYAFIANKDDGDDTNGKPILNSVVMAICEVVLPSVLKSMKTIMDLGLGHLHLNRPISTLSGGERQRVMLSSQLSTKLFGVTYVLDEPTIGLDNIQIDLLSKVLKKMVANGNTVVVVEHDPSFISQADYLIEMGPHAGILGGEVVFQGPLEDIGQAKHSITYQLLTKKYERSANSSLSKHKQGSPFGVKNAFANNLKDIDVNFISRQIIGVKGVSGSGKSSLIKEVLHRSWVKKRPIGCTSVYGLDQFEDILLIDQSSIKQNNLGTPASYTGLLDSIKALFSKTVGAKEAGLKKADFSYQSKQGKCAACGGYGQVKTSMDFMSDIWLPCDKCLGMRYNKQVLACFFQDRSIGDILQMSIQEAFTFFDDDQLKEKLDVLIRVGIGHLRLGQAADTLSAGESQRLKLATSMMQKRKGAILYLFDEPTTGLHYFDIIPLMQVFQTLVNHGDTLLFIEHNTTLMEIANQVVTLGPGSGDQGGEVIS